jgi:hypothetical protein
MKQALEEGSDLAGFPLGVPDTVLFSTNSTGGITAVPRTSTRTAGTDSFLATPNQGHSRRRMEELPYP